MVSSNSLTVDEGEVITYNCTATGAGDLTIEWDVDGVLYNSEICPTESLNCSLVMSSRTSDGKDGISVTGLLEINVTSLNALGINCIINQSFNVSSEEPGIEIRIPLVPVTRKVTAFMRQDAIKTWATIATTQKNSAGATHGKFKILL